MEKTPQQLEPGQEFNRIRSHPVTKDLLLKLTKLGNIYEIQFEYAHTNNKDVTLCIPWAYTDSSMSVNILVVPDKCPDDNLVKKDSSLIRYESIMSIKRVGELDLPLYIGMKTTKSFEKLIRQKKSSSRVTRVS